MDMGSPDEVRDEERAAMVAALKLMRDTFVEAVAMVPDFDKQGEFQGRFFDGYSAAKKTWGLALMKKVILGKTQEPIEEVP